LSLVDNFHKAHQKLYAYHQPGRPVEIVNIRVKSVGSAEKIRLPKRPFKSSNPEGALIKKQKLFYGGKRFEAAVFVRDRLEPGNRISGPALVVDEGSTTLLPPGYLLDVDGLLNLIIERE
jgi:N-methylhydantoinase A